MTSTGKMLNQRHWPTMSVRQRIIDGYRVIYDDATARRMGGIRQKDTAPEIAVRRTLVALGLRYRVRNRDLPGSPDIANRSGGWAVFVHGCYWHRHLGCPRATTPRRNASFWRAKLAANVARDRRAAATLRRNGFRVLIVWECQTVQLNSMSRLVRRFVQKLATSYASGSIEPRIADRIGRSSEQSGRTARRPASRDVRVGASSHSRNLL